MAGKTIRSALNIWVAISVLAVMTFIAVTRLNKVVTPQTIAKPVQSTLVSIAQAGDYYKAEHGIWPETMDELRHSRFLELPPGAESGWTFEIIGNPPTELVAISTEAMTGGAGQEIHYDLTSARFSGYGIDSIVVATN